MLKFAAADVLSADLVPTQRTKGGSLTLRTAHRATFQYEKRPGFLYVRSRMISSRCNDNFDEFPADEIKKAAHTFVGKPVFVNHHNDNPLRARGVIIAFALHEDVLPDGKPDTWVEGLMEVDAIRFPKLAKAILAGEVDRTSMGTDVAFSKCSACGNKATTPLEYCQHIPRQKGQRIYRHTASGTKEGVLVREICYGLGFFENSLLVEEPADPTAYFLGVEAGPGISTTASRYHLPAWVHEEPQIAPRQANATFDAEAYRVGTLVGKQHRDAGLDHDAESNVGYHRYNKDRWERSGNLAKYMEGYTDGHSGTSREASKTASDWQQFDTNRHYRRGHQDGAQGVFDQDHDSLSAKADMGIPLEPHEVDYMVGHAHGMERAREIAHGNSQIKRLYEEHGQAYGSLTFEAFMAEAGAYVEKQPLITGHNIDWTPVGTNGNWRASCSCGEKFKTRDNHGTAYLDAISHVGPNNPDYDEEDIARREQAMHEKHSIPSNKKGNLHAPVPLTDGALFSLAKGEKLGDMSPEQVEHFRKQQEGGRRWNKQNPVHADNVIAHWNMATDHERTSGMNWYRDAHALTKHVANDTGHPMHVAAGLMSNYSPQTHWATNMMNASRAMRERKGIGGKGSGVFASSKQAANADRLMGGEHYEGVLGGPKTKAFAHLIEHGGNADPSDPKVVVDRHALSVAAGQRATDHAYMASGLSGKKRYKEVADVYHKAAQHISKHTGTQVEAHQVQAATWLVRQRLNAGEDKKTASIAEMGRKATTEWNSYAGEHHPLAMGKEPGTGYADAPEDVQHSQDLADEGHHGSIDVLHTPVPHTNPRRHNRVVPKVAYGETMAPAEVDTLREEACPVCGEKDSYDGAECMVCGFMKPPDDFMDPDVDAAKRNDLRQSDDIGAEDVAGLNDDLNDKDGDGLDDESGIPVDAEEDGALDSQPTLGCPTCGFTAEAAEPKSVNPQNPDAPADGAAEGDVCPNCAKDMLVAAPDANDSDDDGIPDDEDPDPDDPEVPGDEEEDPDEEDDEDEDDKKKRPPFGKR